MLKLKNQRYIRFGSAFLKSFESCLIKY